jgi:hypothetical protein
MTLGERLESVLTARKQAGNERFIVRLKPWAARRPAIVILRTSAILTRALREIVCTRILRGDISRYAGPGGLQRPQGKNSSAPPGPAFPTRRT